MYRVLQIEDGGLWIAVEEFVYTFVYRFVNG